MSKQNIVAVLLLLGVGASVLYVISSSGGRESELAKPDISVPADISALEDETRQLARPAPVVNDLSSSSFTGSRGARALRGSARAVELWPS